MSSRSSGLPWLLLGAAGFLALWWLERKRPLRRPVERPVRRLVRNVALSGLSAAVVAVADRPFTGRLARQVERRRWGLLKALSLPPWLEDVLGFVLLDYSLWLWHVLLHRVPALWHAHLVHHADLDLDSSTALRFHFLELMASVPWRAAPIALLGIGPRALAAYQTTLFASVVFQHSNLRLPLGLERALSLVLVTPRMHGIHHSIVEEEAASNWSSLLTVWDRIHGTLRLDVPQRAVTIGVAALRSPAEVTLPRLLVMPFVEQPPSWRLPGGGRPVRAAVVERGSAVFPKDDWLAPMVVEPAGARGRG